MRCYFLRGGHIVAAEELAGVSDKEAIVEAHVLFSERENSVETFEVWDRTRAIIRHPPIAPAPRAMTPEVATQSERLLVGREPAWAGGGPAAMEGEARWHMVLMPSR
jgi:hypothetical protein